MTVRAVPLPRWPLVVEGVTALAFGVLAWRYAATPELIPALLIAAWAGVVLTLTDLRCWRLPDIVTLPAYPILLVALAPTGRLLVATACGLAMAGIYLILWFGRPSGLGFGDVKLAGLIGLVSRSGQHRRRHHRRGRRAAARRAVGIRAAYHPERDPDQRVPLRARYDRGRAGGTAGGSLTAYLKDLVPCCAG